MLQPDQQQQPQQDSQTERPARGDFVSQQITIGGHTLVADKSGALYWPARRLLIVADLHLEKGSASAVRGRMLPPYDTRSTLLMLAEVIVRYDVRTVVALGDSLHDVDAPRRIAPADLDLLRLVQTDRDWIWLAGNHDPRIDAVMGGQCRAEVEISGLCLRHEPRPGRTNREIAAHLHPAAKLATRGMTLRRRCFVADSQRVVLPAFGAYAGGLNVLDEAFAPLFDRADFAVWMLGGAGLYPVATRHLRDD